MKRGIRPAIVGGGVVAALLAAGPASASFVSIGSRDSGTQVQVSGGPGEANDIEISKMGAAYVITDDAGVAASSGSWSS